MFKSIQEVWYKMSEKTIMDIIDHHLESLAKEVEYFENHNQSHGHQDIWIKFLQDILDDKNPKLRNWV